MMGGKILSEIPFTGKIITIVIIAVAAVRAGRVAPYHAVKVNAATLLAPSSVTSRKSALLKLV